MNQINRRDALLCLTSLALFASASVLPVRGMEEPKQATLYKSPDCTCCEGHAAYLKRNGIQVKIIETPDLAGVKKAHGLRPEFESCHTILLDDYVIEQGPADLIR